MKIGLLCRFVPALLLAAGTIVAAAGSAQATVIEVDFGSLTPISGTCTTSTNSSPNQVCTSPLGFTSNGQTFTATGYSDQFSTAAALTLKPISNGLTESGLGENALASVAKGACTDASVATNCEIAGGASVAVVSSVALTDVKIGSVQAGEEFQLWTGSSIAGLAKLGGIVTGLCSGSALCTIDLTTPALAVGVQSITSGGKPVGNILMTAVSFNVPEPGSLALLGTALLGLGLLARRRRRV